MGKKINTVTATFEKDVNGIFFIIQSELIESEAAKHASGMDEPDVYFIRRTTDNTFLFNLSAETLGADFVYRAIRTKGLKDGLRIKVDTPMSPEKMNKIGQTLAEAVRNHIRNHLAAFRVTIRVDVDDTAINWRPSPAPSTSAA